MPPVRVRGLESPRSRCSSLCGGSSRGWGSKHLLEAMVRLGHRDHRLIVVGDGTLRPALEQQSRELGLAGRVRFAGLVDESALRDWYRAADVVVLPTIAYEGFGLATAEALACGTAVVGTPVGATPELLAPLDPRLLATGTTPAELGGAVDRALDLVHAGFPWPLPRLRGLTLRLGSRRPPLGGGAREYRP